MITLINNEKILVNDQPSEIVAKVIEYARTIRAASYLNDTVENS